MKLLTERLFKIWDTLSIIGSVLYALSVLVLILTASSGSALVIYIGVFWLGQIIIRLLLLTYLSRVRGVDWIDG